MSKEYHVIQAPTVDDVTILVNQMAQDGWEPSGGVSLAAVNVDGKIGMAFALLMEREAPTVLTKGTGDWS